MPEDEKQAEGKRAPFYERGAFKGAVAVVGLVAAVWAFTGAPKPWQVAAEINTGPTWRYNTEIIVDSSSAMAKRFGGKTKLEVAVDGISRSVKGNDSENLALRSAGGSCGSEGEELVDFGPDHGDDVVAQAQELHPHGRSNMVAAVLAAIDQFKEERFQNPEAKNRVLIFMGSEDECALDPYSEIKRELARADIEASFQVFALRMSKRQLKDLRHFRHAMKPYAEVSVANAHTVEQFEKAVQPVLEEGETVNTPAGSEAVAPEAEPKPDGPEGLVAPEEASQGETGKPSTRKTEAVESETETEPVEETTETTPAEPETSGGETTEEAESRSIVPEPTPGETTTPGRSP